MRDHVLDLRPLRAARACGDLAAGSAAGGRGSPPAHGAVLRQVWELTRSPLWTGTIGLATAVPLLTLGLVGGHLADVHDRRTLMRLAAVGQVLSAAGLAAQALAGNRSVWLLLGLVAAGAACGARGSPAPGLDRRKSPARTRSPTPTIGTPRSLALFRWSPARMPRPPEYWGSTDVMPNSGEKYAIAAGREPPPSDASAARCWYHSASSR